MSYRPHGHGQPAVVSTSTSAGYAAPAAGHLFLKPSTPPSYLHGAAAPSGPPHEDKG